MVGGANSDAKMGAENKDCAVGEGQSREFSEFKEFNEFRNMT